MTRRAAAAAAIGLIVAACGTGDPLPQIEAGGDPSSTTATTTVTTAEQTTSSVAGAPPSTTTAPTLTTGTPVAADAPNPFPDLIATDVATGQSVSLRSLGETGTPAVLWFWYPH
ncbi:MAG: hypothetical protein HKN03_03335 [Acidimicrobiales bacterium]|nr:hypothetical protein [Acidimicrobiales bacterium]